MSTPSTRRRATLLTALGALLALLFLLPAHAPTATADQGEHFVIYPEAIQAREAVETVKVCVPTGTASSDTVVRYDFFETHNDAVGGILSESAAWDDETCANIELERSFDGGPDTPYLAVAHSPGGLGGDVSAVYWIGTNGTFNGTNETQLAGTLSLDGFTSFDTRLPQLLFLGLLILAYWNRWYAAGTFALAAAIATEFTGGPGILDYTLGYVGFALFVALEALLSGTRPMRRLRSFFEDRGEERGRGVS